MHVVIGHRQIVMSDRLLRVYTDGLAKIGRRPLKSPGTGAKRSDIAVGLNMLRITGQSSQIRLIGLLGLCGL